MRAIWRSTFGLVAIVCVIFATATFAVGAAVYRAAHEALELQLDHRIAIEMKALTDEGNFSRSGIAGAIQRRDAARTTASLDYLLLDAKGARLAGALELAATPTLGYREHLRFRQNGQWRVAQALTNKLGNGDTLIVAADRGPIQEMDAALKRLVRGSAGIMLVLGIGAAWLVGSITSARLARIDATALAIIGGDLGRRMPLTGAGDEFDRVSATLNKMLDRIGSLMTNLRQVSSDVAHDLRTPLTRLHNRLEDASHAPTADARASAIAAASAQSRELLDIFASLLRIAEIEALPLHTHFKPIALTDLVLEILDTYRPDFEAREHDLQLAIAGDIEVRGDRRLLQQLVTNLLDNVLRHTPAGTAVRVSLGATDDEVWLAVIDDGPGVDPGEGSRLFQRFARGERSRSTEGHGLGLSLVAAIAQAHGGSVVIADRAGFEIVVTLPATSSTEAPRTGPIVARRS